MTMTYRHFKNSTSRVMDIGPIFVINYRLMLRIVLEAFIFLLFPFLEVL